MNLDTETATGRTMLQVLGAVAEHARASMLERQREGIAKTERKYKGRAKTAMAKAAEVEKTAGCWREADAGRPQARHWEEQHLPRQEGAEDLAPA